jgi:hypothetical protein
MSLVVSTDRFLGCGKPASDGSRFRAVATIRVFFSIAALHRSRTP